MFSLWCVVALFSTVQAYVLSTTQQHCVDHYLMFKYDGNGNVLIAGADLLAEVTIRDDCNDYPQGWSSSVSFDVTKFSDQNIMVTVSGDDGNVQCSGSMYINIHTRFDYTVPNCVWGNPGAQFPMVKTSVTFDNPAANPSITPMASHSSNQVVNPSSTPIASLSSNQVVNPSSTPIASSSSNQVFNPSSTPIASPSSNQADNHYSTPIASASSNPAMAMASSHPIASSSSNPNIVSDS